MIVDGDSHIYELPTLWETRLDSRNRHLALRIEPDELGYSYLTYQGQRLQFVVPTIPSDPDFSKKVRERKAAGLPAEAGLYDQVPSDCWDISARSKTVEADGIDQAILYPQFQGIIESALRDDGDGARANMEAWNRWALEVTSETGGQLRPVGHLRLDQRPDWVVEQVRLLGEGGVRLAMFVPGLVDGKPPSHADNDSIWNAFVEYGVTPAWHSSGGHRFAIDSVSDWEPVEGGGFGLATGMFLRVASQLALSDMVFNGVFERHEGLHVVISEFGVDWLESFLDEMDLRLEILHKQQGRASVCLRKKPSEYFLDRVTIVVSCPTDRDFATVARSATGLAFGSDYPHGCGFSEPLRGFQAQLGDCLGALHGEFYGDRLALLL